MKEEKVGQREKLGVGWGGREKEDRRRDFSLLLYSKLKLLAPLAIGHQIMSWPVVHRASVCALTFSLNILSETTYRILMKFTEMFLPWSSSKFLEII